MSEYRTYKVCYKEDSSTVQRILTMDAKSPKDAAYCLGKQMGYKCRQQFQGMLYDYVIEITEQEARNATKGLIVEVCSPSKVDKPHRFFKVTE